MSAELTLQNRKRGIIKSSLTAFISNLDKLDKKFIDEGLLDKNSIVDLEQRICKAENLLAEYDTVNNAILALIADDQVAANYAERTQFSDLLFNNLARAKILLADSQPPADAGITQFPNNTNGSIPSLSVDNTQNIKLPPLKLVNFSGKYSEWLSFYDTFSSLIHNNSALTPIQKFHYLRSCLQIEALQVVQNLEISAANYEPAFSLLEKRYKNKKLMIHNHIKGIVEHDAINKESVGSLRELLDSVQNHLRALEALYEPVEKWDSILIYIITNKLDYNSKKEWEALIVKDEGMPTITTLIEFLEQRCSLLEKIQKQITQSPITRESNSKNRRPNHKLSYVSSTTNEASQCLSCPSCGQSHAIYACDRFLSLPESSRIVEIKKLKLCSNCLRTGHSVSNCRSYFKCRICRKRHNTLLHVDNNLNKATSGDSGNNSQADTAQVSLNHHINFDCGSNILPTAEIHIFDRLGRPVLCTVLLDSGSMSNFITSNLCRKLKLGTTKTNIPILGINDSKSKISEITTATIQSRTSNYKSTLSFLVIPKITENVPPCNINIGSFKLPPSQLLANPSFFKSKPIDMILGVDIFWDLLRPSSSSPYPYLHDTQLGYVFSGTIPNQITNNRQAVCNFSSLDLSNQLSRFWEIENSFSNSPHLSIEERQCETNFLQSTRRNEQGHFVVTIPLRNSLDTLGESKQEAIKFFLGHERRLQRNSNLREMCIKFMRDYEALGHMSEVDASSDDATYSFYMPYHCVIKEQSLTTKCRIVFNGSHPSDTGISINDLQMEGPTIQRDLLSILLSFRKHEYVISADCTKMYRSVYVEPSQRSLQRIIWRSTPQDSLRIYNLNTVTYGLTSSSFLAIRCLFSLADEVRETHPEISRIIKDDFYVNDLLSGANTIEEATYICRHLAQILKSGGFELRKWISNEPSILNSIQSSEIECNIIEFDSNESIKTLGLSWSSRTDKLLFQFNMDQHSRCLITKRTVLGLISKIFDSLGLISPCVINAKILMQKLWVENLSWDEPLPAKFQSEWLKYTEELSHVKHLEIPRKACLSTAKHIEIHAFCDASQLAYGGCIYIKSVDDKNNVLVELMCSKTRVSPLKTLSIPRLELLGAHIVCKLVKKVVDSLGISFSRIVYWSDSTIVLGWIHTSPHLLKTFVANRVAEIQSLSNPSNWLYIPTSENPADILSRGSTPLSLHNTCWFHGPAFLSDSLETSWPNQNYESQVRLPETKHVAQSLVITKSESVVEFERYSNLTKLERILGYCFRFINNCQTSRARRITGPLTRSEIRNSHVYLIKLVQKETFSSEINILLNKGNLSKSSRLINVNPFIHTDGILRVGGRIQASEYTFDKRHPMILPYKHKFTELLAIREHVRLFHAGPQMTLASLREAYWPLSGRNLVRSIIHKCVRCFKVKPKSVQPIMGNLPKERITPSYPFQVCGTDYAGPVRIKDRKGRGSKTSKAYICLFKCFSTKAIHIELVSDLTTEAFILALRRFASRRSLPAKLYSDNGTNFVGANAELKELASFLTKNNKQISTLAAQENVDWQFIPPYSPHMAGYWESGIRCIKYHLKRVLGDIVLTFEELYSLLAQVEAVLNSRPLTPLSSHPSDLNPLTPAHFLVGRPLTTVPDPDVTNIQISRLSNYQRIQQLVQHFWKRWSKECISEMQQRAKWKINCNNIEEGSMVIVKDDNCPPSRWHIGRVVSLHPGADGIVRVVSIRTQRGTIRRAVARICPLPIDSD